MNAAGSRDTQTGREHNRLRRHTDTQNPSTDILQSLPKAGHLTSLNLVFLGYSEDDNT